MDLRPLGSLPTAPSPAWTLCLVSLVAFCRSPLLLVSVPVPSLLLPALSRISGLQHRLHQHPALSLHGEERRRVAAQLRQAASK